MIYDIFKFDRILTFDRFLMFDQNCCLLLGHLSKKLNSHASSMAGKVSKGPGVPGDYTPSALALASDKAVFGRDEEDSDDELDYTDDGGPSGANIGDVGEGEGESEDEGEEEFESSGDEYSQECLDPPSGEGQSKKRARESDGKDCALKKKMFDETYIALLEKKNRGLMKELVEARVGSGNFHRIGFLKLSVKKLKEEVRTLEKENRELTARVAKYTVDPSASGDPRTLEHFLNAASVHRLMDGIADFNETIKCCCFSCHFQNFG